MATVPITHTVTDGVATSSEMNSYFRDPVSFLLNKPAAELYSVAGQSIPNGAQTALTFDTEKLDSDPSGTGGHSTAVNTSRYTAVYPGWYRVYGRYSYLNNATGVRTVSLAVNGAQLVGTVATGPVPTAAFNQCVATSALVFLNVGDYIEILVLQTSGGALQTDVSFSANPNMTVEWVRNA